MDAKLVIEPVWSWPLVAITAMTMIALVLWTYPPRVAHFPPRWSRTLVGLRCAAAAILCLAMLRPTLRYSETDRQFSQLNIVMDSSRSMSTPDGPGGISRRELLLKLLNDHTDQLAKLEADQIDVQFFDFGRSLTSVETPENKADDNFTAIGKVIDQIREDAAGDRLIGTFLIGDGAQRAVGEDDINPLAAARRYAEQLGIPIHTLTLGTSEISAAGIDLAIEELLLSQSVTFEKKTVPVNLRVKLQGAANRKVRVRLLMEDRTGKREGEAGEMKELPLSADARPFIELETTSNNVTLPVELSFVAEQAGEYKIAAEVVPDRGEVKLDNNRLETLITVRKGGLKVLYVDVPRIEQKFIRRLNETAKIQIDTQEILAGRFQEQTALSPELFAEEKYDVYIIGDVPAAVFEKAHPDLLRQLALRVNEGAGLLMTGGLNNFSTGGYGATPLAVLLPVRLSPNERPPSDEPNPEDHILTRVRMLPTERGNDRYLMNLAAAQNRELWEQFPALGGANRLVPKSGAVEVLAATEAGDPLLLATETGRGRVVALGVDETWKWHLHGFAAEHQRFWQQMILWLAHKEFDSDQPVWVRVQPRNFSPSAKVPIEFGAQTTEGSPLPDASFQVEVLTPDGETVRVPPQRFGDHGLADFLQTQEPGDYWVRVSGQHAGQSLGLPATTRFVVDSRDLELDNPAADPGLMAEIANMTGGEVVRPEEFGSFLDRIRQEGIPAELKRYRHVNLWDGWPPLLAFVCLMTLEWFIRKWRGLV